MKRWQTCGEVPDSDDENLSLELESQSPAKKRARRNHESDNGTPIRRQLGAKQSAESQVEDGGQDEEWLRPKVANTYGRKSKTPRALVDHNQPDETLPQNRAASGLSEQISVISRRRSREGTPNIPVGPPDVKTPLVAVNDTSRGITPDLDERSSKFLSLPASPHSPAVPDVNSTEQPPQSSGLESLPDLRELLHGRQPVDTTDKEVPYDGASSGLSSPLSERSISPPPPPTSSRALRAADDGEAIERRTTEDSNHSHADIPSSATPPELLEPSFTGRRTFRARQEKQLHPYMFDKQQYQRQCRERGVRPVRVMEAEQRDPRPHRPASSDDDQGTWQSSQDRALSPARPSSEIGAHSVVLDQDDSDDPLPDIRPPFRRIATGVVLGGWKRRKLSHPPHQPRLNALPADEFSVPPSPPPTSSDPNVARTKSEHPAVFKYPRGMTPVQQPTPHVSSALRGAQVDSDDEPRRRSRLFSAPKSRSTVIDVESPSESSARSGPEPDAAVNSLLQPLQRERKRIRGVLPASWLRIDFKAQQRLPARSPAKDHARDSDSPAKTAPQKGVAQRVFTRRSGSPHRSAPIPISDDDSDGDNDHDLSNYISLPKKQQSRLRFERASDSATPFALDDDDIDAMLAGGSGSRSHPRSSRKRQPRIKDALNHTRGSRHDFSEETSAARRAKGMPKGSSKSTQERKKAPKRPSAPCLSVVDAPLGENTSGDPTPQFLRLAIRKARAREDSGRHSPTKKHIRLATKEDTEEATLTLQAWREGTISRRPRPQLASGAARIDLANDDSEQEDDGYTANEQRPPLAELSINRQQRLPHAVRKATVDREKGARRAVVRQPQLRQTRLRPVQLNDEERARHSEQPPGFDLETMGATPKRSHPQSNNQRAKTHYRRAQVETLESDFDQHHRAAAFERRMHVLTENVVRQSHRRTPAAPIQLERFLHDPDAVQPQHLGQKRATHGAQVNENIGDHAAVGRGRTLTHRPRKQPAQRLDVETRQYRQPSEPIAEIVEISAHAQTEQLADGSDQVLKGLGPFGTRYPIDFDILPLPLGTFFHESSFIGSGDFAASLDFAGRNLDVATGRIRIHVGLNIHDFGMWNEEVAAGLATIPVVISEALQELATKGDLSSSEDTPELVLANVDYLLRSSVRYFTRCLAFSGPIDRRTCIKSMQSFSGDILDAAVEISRRQTAISDICARCLQYAVVLSRQAVMLCSHGYVHPEVKLHSQEMLRKASTQLAKDLITKRLDSLRSLYEDVRRAVRREAGLRDTDVAICSLTILHHAILETGLSQMSLLEMLYRSLDVHAASIDTVSSLDRVWNDMLTILPALEIDARGILQVGSRLVRTTEDWTLARSLLERLFTLYPATSLLSASTINDYFRATLSRIAHLVSRWGWYRSEPILYSISDFFTSRGLALLHKEQCQGSARFLEELTESPSFEVQMSDRSYHIFLKILTTSLLKMRGKDLYSDKRIGGLVWRFIPNHGRTHYKDADVAQEQLDALRNHHDLLCTLYYASPPENRLRVALVQNLVDHSASHREACRLNIRAWRNLASFQASTGEPADRLEPLARWFRELMATNIRQYRLARIETEQDVAAARASGKQEVAQDIIESTIAANQRQIAAIILDALASIKHALESTSSSSSALALVAGSEFWHAFDLFEPAARKTFAMFNEGFEVIRTALTIQSKFQGDQESPRASDDSQDYGDSGALQELASTQAPTRSTDCSMADALHEPLAHILSTVFGADGASDDELLTNLVNVWTQLAGIMVASGRKTWENYISSYSSEAWSQLRDTAQRRKYTPYFLARIAQSREADLAETGILAFWLKSLVEREASLKFQHTLTNALLSRHDTHALLVNLPFVRPQSGHSALSLSDLRQSRLGLVSSVLSNMHQNYESTMRLRPQALQGLRRAYAEMLRQMMQAMKANYQDVQLSTTGVAADPRAQGDYIGFVQQVVSFLQQYTTDICPVDRFFVDSAAFPLPATDPTYVVGRLKGYVSKLSEARRRKELAFFVQTVSERAAVDGQQRYLTDQLTAAMGGVLERGDPRAPSLRHVLMTAILPAYVENALSNACSWILALPILQACGTTMQNLLYSVVLDDHGSKEAAMATIAVPLACMVKPLEFALAYPGQLMVPHALRTLAAIFDALTQSLTTVEHLARTNKDQEVMTVMKYIDRLANAIQEHLAGTHDEIAMQRTNMPERLHWEDTSDFARKQFRDNMSRWSARDGQYYIRQGAKSSEIVAHLDDEGQERERLVQALGRFRTSYATVFEKRPRVTVAQELAEVVV